MNRRIPRARITIATAAIFALTASVAACSPGTAPQNDAAARTLTYATGDAEPTCLDPHVGGNYPQALIGSQFIESLVSLDEAGEIVPWLATGWIVSNDGLEWDFTLDPDATFSDGNPVDAAAVQANIEHLQDPETASSTGYLAVQQIESVEVVDPTTVRFTLSRPDAALLESLAQVWVGIQSPAGIERGQDENCLAPIGSGPFMVEAWQKQDRVILVKNPEYRTPPAGFDEPPAEAIERVEWRFIPDATARFQALEAGQVDVIDNPLPDQITQAVASDELDHLNAPRPGASNRIELNSAEGPFSDIRVREAFIAAVDIDAAVSSLFDNTAERSHSALSSVEPTALQSPEAYVYDPEQAEVLLEEAGWTEKNEDGMRVKDGESLTVRLPISTNQSVPAEQALFEQMQASASEVGFDLQISLLDLSSWYGALANHEYELVSAPYTKIGPDVLRFLYHSDATVPAPSGYFANNTQVQDPELDALLDTIGTESDAETRNAAAEAAQQLIAEKSLILPLYDQQNHFLYRSNIAGFRALTTVSTPVLADITRSGA